VRNLEFKASLTNANEMMARARSLGADLWGDLRQTDTYFEVASGRLKLRETAGYQAELVFYQRAESSARRESDYFVTVMPDAATALEVLSRALAVRTVVRKKRTLVLLDTTRVHFDNVDGLGQFLEIEVPVGDDEEAAERRLNSLIEALGLSWEDCIRKSYADLLLEKSA
jgi:predicted adenylyl cyclase CyaB